ncbi:MAG: transglutaminase-like domain-containing protein [Candidatus Omnitrophica bacterium]|nr:transglutaminase-like domain-containing protein [Candidatus Omnitrophota bacterium]
MSSAAINELAAHLSERQWNALISLLADDDPAVYRTIRSTILSYGKSSIAWLRPFALARDPVLRRRAQEIIHYLSRQEADRRFMGFCRTLGEDLDVELGAWLLAQTLYPDINVAAYQALLDGYAAELRDRLAGQAGAEKILATINQYLFGELGFTGNEQNYYDPENSYFSRVLDRRLGNPITLCLLFLLISRRLRLPVVGIGMPGHFLCRYQSSTGETFIDAFNRGKLLTKAECIKYLLQSGHGYLEGYLAPVSPRRMLLRMCANLHQIYVDLELPKESSRFQRYIVALSK